jgi:tetratricopeptide (TPR) repeat protein
LEFLAALGDVYLLAGEPKKAEEQFATVEAIATLDAANQVLYNRQLTLFYANHGRKIEDAVTLAQQELLARQDIYGYDTLAWALYQRGDFAAAADAMAQAMQLGTQDALVFYHAGMIEAALGNHATARDWLTRALAMNPAFDPWQVPIAQAKLTEIGD